jgi:hypothetical protein
MIWSQVEYILLCLPRADDAGEDRSPLAKFATVSYSMSVELTYCRKVTFRIAAPHSAVTGVANPVNQTQETP